MGFPLVSTVGAGNISLSWGKHATSNSALSDLLLTFCRRQSNWSPKFASSIWNGVLPQDGATSRLKWSIPAHAEVAIEDIEIDLFKFLADCIILI